MKFCARAPVRIDFLGGGSDCPPYSSEFTGAVLNAGISKYVTAEVILKGDGVSITSADLGLSIDAPDLGSLPTSSALDLLVACAKRCNLKSGFSLRTKSDVPSQSGLGASGAIAVATLAAIKSASGEQFTPSELADLAFIVERKDLGYPGGSQDQYAAAFGGFNYLTFHDPTVEIEQLAGRHASVPWLLDRSIISALEHRLLLVYTGAPHFSPTIHADIYNSYLLPNSLTKAAMHHLKQLALKGRRILLEGNLHQFAKLLTENWKWHKHLHSSCTNSKLEQVYDVALRSGAIGGKTCGAGGGGCVVFLCENDSKDKLREALQNSTITDLQLIDFSFDVAGLEIWKGE